MESSAFKEKTEVKIGSTKKANFFVTNVLKLGNDLIDRGEIFLWF